MELQCWNPFTTIDGLKIPFCTLWTLHSPKQKFGVILQKHVFLLCVWITLAMKMYCHSLKKPKGCSSVLLPLLESERKLLKLFRLARRISWNSRRKSVYGNTGITTFKDNKVAGPISAMRRALPEFQGCNSTCEDKQKCWVRMWAAGLVMGAVGGVWDLEALDR